MNVISKLPFDNLLNFGTYTGLTATGVSGILDGKQNTKLDRKTLVIDVASADRTTEDETYSVTLELSNSDDMSGAVDKVVYVLPVASLAGRHTVEVDNEVAGVYYRYSRIAYTLAGTTPILAGTTYYSIVSSI